MRANVPAPVRAVAEPIGVGLHQLVGGAAYAASAVPRVLGMPGAADAMSNFAATASATNEPDIQGVEQGGYFANGVGGFLKKAAVTGLEMEAWPVPALKRRPMRRVSPRWGCQYAPLRRASWANSLRRSLKSLAALVATSSLRLLPAS
jgi:hypothetical protein